MKLMKKIVAQLTTPDTERLATLQAQRSAEEALKEQTQAAIGEAYDAGLPTTKANADYEAVEKKIRDLTAAIAVVEKRIHAAKELAKVEELKRKRETVAAALADLQEKARAMGATFEAVRRDAQALAASLGAAQAAVGALGDEKFRHVTDGGLKFKFYLLHAASVMPACKVPYVASLLPYHENFPRPDEV
jgi:chromosome segregation ATPase